MASPVNFKQWYQALNRGEREEFARRAGVSMPYIEISLCARRKIPRRDTMIRLSDASLGRLPYEELVAWFYGRPAA